MRVFGHSGTFHDNTSNMSKVLLILLFLSVLYYSEAVDAEACKITPYDIKQGHCLIEHPVAHRWPHTKRYVYNWTMKNCYEIRWANHCPPVPDPPTANNFPTEASCLSECGGWA